MKTVANMVKAVHAAQPRATNRSALKAVMAPKPMLLSAAPTPGPHTETMTFMRPVCKRGIAGMPCNGTMQSNVASGSSVVASAIAEKPKRAYSMLPIGAPTANAANIALPTHASARLVFRAVRIVSAQICPPTMMKLSPTPSTARPSSRTVTETKGRSEKLRDRK